MANGRLRRARHLWPRLSSGHTPMAPCASRPSGHHKARVHRPHAKAISVAPATLSAASPPVSPTPPAGSRAERPSPPHRRQFAAPDQPGSGCSKAADAGTDCKAAADRFAFVDERTRNLSSFLFRAQRLMSRHEDQPVPAATASLDEYYRNLRQQQRVGCSRVVPCRAHALAAHDQCSAEERALGSPLPAAGVRR